ncbi:MAG TPA: hypothetical protein VKJ65_01175 [Phycisphaerae bacterium]|nr:hypothetical protein [Phycisphaerae bacterium]
MAILVFSPAMREACVATVLKSGPDEELAAELAAELVEEAAGGLSAGAGIWTVAPQVSQVAVPAGASIVLPHLGHMALSGMGITP